MIILVQKLSCKYRDLRWGIKCVTVAKFAYGKSKKSVHLFSFKKTFPRVKKKFY